MNINKRGLTGKVKEIQSYNTPERKDKPGDRQGGVMIYVKIKMYFLQTQDGPGNTM